MSRRARRRPRDETAFALMIEQPVHEHSHEQVNLRRGLRRYGDCERARGFGKKPSRDSASSSSADSISDMSLSGAEAKEAAPSGMSAPSIAPTTSRGGSS